MPTYEERIAQREMLQRKAIADATAVGFRDCHAVFNALGFDLVNAGGITRSSLQVSSRWIVDAGFVFESIVPDGLTDIPKAERTGCHVDDLPDIVAYKDSWYAEGRQYEWDKAHAGAVEAQAQYGDDGDMNWTVYLESLGERPEADLTAVEAGRARRETRDAAERQADRARDVVLLAAIRAYDGPLNRKGRAKMRPFRRHLEDYDVGYVSRAERNALYGDGQQ